MTLVNRVRRGFYLDSVALMRHSRTIAELPGVVSAALMMGSSANKEVMTEAGLLAREGKAARGDDLVIGVRAETSDAAEAALAEAERWLDQPKGDGAAGEDWQPQSIRTALQAMPDANLAIISVPGEYAAAEARKALRRGLNVMIFSDNVSLEDERALKIEASESGRLVMGPDCGTAIINGVPLAFANRVPRGAIAIVGASGTGMQEISTLIARAGQGISQAIGVGGRDLDEAIGGISTLMALDVVDRDPLTRHVVLVSKPPSAAVAERISERLARSDKRFTVCFLGAGRLGLPDNARLVTTLKAAAEAASDGAAIGGRCGPATMPAMPPGRGRRITGLYSGGTLCAETQIVLLAAGEAVASNAPVPGASQLSDGSEAHRMIDLGATEYTLGRPHPMIDPAVRDVPLTQALGDPDVGIVLLDLVIGYGAHEDPAGHLARMLAGRPAASPIVIASVTGTEADPQGRSHQVAKLCAAGVQVAPSNADAAELACAVLKGDG